MAKTLRAFLLDSGTGHNLKDITPVFDSIICEVPDSDDWVVGYYFEEDPLPITLDEIEEAFGCFLVSEN